MLNHLRIGTKLFSGFAVVLVLLVAVWLTGWYATSQVMKMAEEVDASNQLAQGGITMQKETYRALFAAANEALYKEERYAKDVHDIMAGILEKYSDLDQQMRTKEAKDTFAELIKTIGEFSDSDAGYWRLELRRAAAIDARDKSAEAMMSVATALIHQISEASATPQFSREIEGTRYVQMSRLQLRSDTTSLTAVIRDITALAYRYELVFDPAVKTKLRKEMEDAYARLKHSVEAVRATLQTDIGKTRLNEYEKNMADWWPSLNDALNLIDEQFNVDEKTTEIAGSLAGILDVLLGYFNTRADRALQEANATGTAMSWLLVTISIIAIIFGLVISLMLTNNITGGLKRAVTAMKVIADEGNVSVELSKEDTNRGDEVGDMAKAFKNIVQQFQSVEQLANNLATGNYDISTKVRGDLDTMNINLNKMLDQVNEVLSEINEGVKQVATGSGEVSSASQALSSGAQESAASLEQITASMSEISSQTKANAESAGQARDLAQKASNAATQGQEAMQQMTGAMTRITQNSNEIQRVIKVIDDIAFQTNLLALNAAVEAARAGQHGKGFAVVSEEVRNLASRSAKAARETSELIAKSGQEIEKGGEVANHTAEVLNTIVDQIKQTTELVGGIAVASNEQAQGVNQVTIGLQQIDSVTQQNTAAAEQSASAASEMSSMAVSLQRQVDKFKLRGQPKKSGSPSPAPTPAPPAVQHTPLASAGAGHKPAMPKLAPAGAGHKPAAAAKPAAAPAAHKPPITGAHPSEPVAGDQWGGGKTAEIQIDLDDKNFGKY